MTPPHSLFQALLRPAVLQILRATGFHSTRPAVLDSLTDLAARYLLILCHATAIHAAANSSCHADTAAILPDHSRLHNPAPPPPAGSRAPLPSPPDDAPEPSIVDVRMALQDVGALVPDRSPAAAAACLLRPPAADHHHQAPMLLDSEDDLADVHDFIAWFSGARMREIQAFALVDGEAEAMDYLNALKKKHSKTGEESKYHGTILGRGNEQGEVQVEGGGHSSIQSWMERLFGLSTLGGEDDDSQSSSITVGDYHVVEEMEL